METFGGRRRARLRICRLLDRTERYVILRLLRAVPIRAQYERRQPAHLLRYPQPPIGGRAYGGVLRRQTQEVFARHRPQFGKEIRFPRVISRLALFM